VRGAETVSDLDVIPGSQGDATSGGGPRSVSGPGPPHRAVMWHVRTAAGRASPAGAPLKLAKKSAPGRSCSGPRPVRLSYVHSRFATNASHGRRCHGRAEELPRPEGDDRAQTTRRDYAGSRDIDTGDEAAMAAAAPKASTLPQPRRARGSDTLQNSRQTIEAARYEYGRADAPGQTGVAVTTSDDRHGAAPRSYSS